MVPANQASVDAIWEACQLATGAKLANGPALESATLSDAGIESEADLVSLVAALQEKVGKVAAAGLTVESLVENPTLGEVAGLLCAERARAVSAPIETSTTKRSTPPVQSGMRNSFVVALRCLAVAALCAPAAAFDSDLGFELDANGCVKNYDATTHYYPAARRAMFVKDDVGVPSHTEKYAELFDIEYHRTFKIVRNLKKGGVYVLHHCGTPTSSIAESLPADAAEAVVFTVPIQRVSTDTTVTLAFLEELRLFKYLEVADMTYVTSPCLHELEKCGDTAHAAKPYNCDNEAGPCSDYLNTIDTLSDLHFVGMGEHANFTKDVPFDGSGDPSLLGRAEWIKWIAAFWNREPEANRIFRDIERNLYYIQKKVGGRDDPPTIVFVGWSSYSGEWTINRPEYKMEAILKSGGRPLELKHLKGWNSSMWNSYDRTTVDVRMLKEALKHVDVVVDETWVSDVFEYTMETFYANYGLTAADAGTYRFLANDEVLRLDATVAQYFSWAQGNDFYEEGVIRADYFVEELASYTFHFPTKPVHTTKFMRNLAEGELPRLVNDSHSLDPFCVCEGDAGPPEPGPEYNDCVDEVCIIQDLATLASPPPPPSPSPTPPPSPPPPIAPPPADTGDDDGVPTWAIAVIAVVAGLLLILAVGVCVLISKEKAGTPIFTNIGVKGGGYPAQA